MTATATETSTATSTAVISWHHCKLPLQNQGMRSIYSNQNKPNMKEQLDKDVLNTERTHQDNEKSVLLTGKQTPTEATILHLVSDVPSQTQIKLAACKEAKHANPKQVPKDAK